MPSQQHPHILTTKQIERAKPKDKSYRQSDMGDLFLFITPTSAKVWRMRYRFECKEQTLSIDDYPGVSLSEARAIQASTKLKIQADNNPASDKKVLKTPAATRPGADTFHSISQKRFESRKTLVKYTYKIMSMFNKDIFPFIIGDLPIVEIKPMVLLVVLKRFEERGAVERARKARRRYRAVFRYAIGTDRADYNPAHDLSVAMGTPKPEYYPFLRESKIGEFNRALAGYGGGVPVKVATQICSLLICVPCSWVNRSGHLSTLRIKRGKYLPN